MDAGLLLIFAGALVIAAGSPGPSIAALVSRVIARGWRDVVPFLAAMWIGEAIWLTMAVFGLAVLAETLHWAFLALKYVGAAYLLFLAWVIWRSPVPAESQAAAPRAGSGIRMFLAGLAVTLGNPKIMVFYLALLPSIVELARVTLVAWFELTLTMLVVLAAIDLAYVSLAVRARTFFKSPYAVRLANKIGATVMGGAAVAIAAK